MTNILRGNAIEYEIEEFVASGQESIVYRAKVKSTGRCVALKFRRKEGLGKFRKKELPIYQQLDHLNIIKIFDYIEDLGGLRLEGEKEGVKYIIDRSQYYCVVEDFVTGAPLEDNKSSSLYYYCRQHSPKKEASYEDVINFQADYIIKWIFEFCDIMTHMTRENRVLHLDIKPENIMVTRTGSIVLIDMGLSGFMEPQSSVMNLQYDFDHINADLANVERRYMTIEDEKVLVDVYGTRGFAAPECYHKDGEGWEQDEKLKNPFATGRAGDKDGLVDIRSDIFSFGCVLWDVIHLGGYGGDGKHRDYATIKKEETKDGYFKRDLHYASPYYLQELEDIILKCTHEDPDKRYQDYDELRKAAERVKRNLPKSEENIKKARTLRRIGLVSLLVAALFFVLWRQGLGLGYEIARQNFQEEASEYHDEHTRRISFRDISLSLLDEAASAGNPIDPILRDILGVVAESGRVSSAEFSEILHRVLAGRDANDYFVVYFINTAMQKPLPGNDINTLSIFIANNFADTDSIGRHLASAIANRRGAGAIASFETLINYQDLSEYNISLNHLARNLLTEEAIRNNPEHREAVEDIVRQTEVAP